MDADGRVNLRIGRCHHCLPWRLRRIDRPRTRAADRCRIRQTISLVIPAMMEGSPAPRTLILRLEPIPAQGWICALALAWIGNEKSMLLSQSIHAGPCGEVVGILRAAMQHDDQWAASAGMMTTRNIELVASPSGSAGIGPA